jgi:hypothetical protein
LPKALRSTLKVIEKDEPFTERPTYYVLTAIRPTGRETCVRLVSTDERKRDVGH